MSEETKYIRIRSVNSTMKLLYGDKLTWTEKAIRLRSNLVHMELQFSDRYGSISFSATKADGCNCCRFKMIKYSHPYRWSTILIPVTAEQEARIFEEACRMAGLSFPVAFTKDILRQQKNGYYSSGYYYSLNECIYSSDAIKYDTAGVSLSFISKRRWWNPSNKRNFCNETCALVLREVWPNVIAPHLPHELTPEQTHFLIEYFFRDKP